MKSALSAFISLCRLEYNVVYLIIMPQPNGFSPAIKNITFIASNFIDFMQNTEAPHFDLIDSDNFQPNQQGKSGAERELDMIC